MHLLQSTFWYLFDWLGTEFDKIEVWYEELDTATQVLGWIFGGTLGVLAVVGGLIATSVGVWLIIVVVSEEGDDLNA